MNLILNSSLIPDSDILAIEEIYNKSEGCCFWVAESIDDNNTKQQQ